MNKLLLSLSLFLFTTLSFAQFYEGFENAPAVTSPLPAIWPLSSGNWAVFDNNVGTVQSWGINLFATGLQYQGINCASVSRESIGMGNTSEDWLATPALTVSPSGVSELHFYSRMFTAGDQGTIFKVCVAPAIDPSFQSNPSAYTVVQQWTETTLNSNASDWEEKIVDLSAYAGFEVYIAFVRVYTQPSANIDGDRWMIDNVGFNGQVPCYVSGSAAAASNTSINLYVYSSQPNPVEAIIVPCNDPAPAPTDSGIPVTTSYQFTNLIPNTCYKAYIKNNCSGTPVWQPVSVNYNYAPIHLVGFIDANNNGIKDSGETYSSNGLLSITDNNSGNVSYYYMSHLSFIPSQASTSFNFGYQIYAPYNACNSQVTTNYNNILPSFQPQTFYFPVIPTTPDCFDNKVTLSVGTPPRPGMNDMDYVTVSAIGANTPGTGVLTYTNAPQTTVISVIPSTGVVLTPTGFTWNYSGLTTYNPVQLQIVKSVPPIPMVNIGETLTNSASISFTPSDLDPSNNQYSISETVVGSYDPNDISETHGPQIQFDQFSQNDYLYYTIRFQNTGTANAIRVFVSDVLDSKTDPTSISMVAASHNYNMIRAGNTVSWEFNNIQLPPASVNEALSNGFITYRVKLNPGFAIGDIIPNTASIYFDSNPAIVTNTFNTQFVQQLGTPDFNANTVSIYPNPASTSIQISQIGNSAIQKLSFYDVSGKRVLDYANPSVVIDISPLERGVYFVEITSSENKKAIKKLIINK